MTHKLGKHCGTLYHDYTLQRNEVNCMYNAKFSRLMETSPQIENTIIKLKNERVYYLAKDETFRTSYLPCFQQEND